MSATVALNGSGTLGFPPGAFGAHDGHNIHPHHHAGQPEDRYRWCSRRWFCMTCPDGKARGTWFWGPECVRPQAAAKGGGRDG